MKLITVFFLAIIVKCNSHEFSTSLTQELLSKFYNSSYLLSVPSLLKVAESSKSTCPQEYNTLHYLLLLKNETPSIKKLRPIVDESINELPYAALFENYIAANRQVYMIKQLSIS
jgi:hypothetical protein